MCCLFCTTHLKSSDFTENKILPKCFSPVDCTGRCFSHLFSPSPWWMLELLRWCTYSSFPRKEVSLHATFPALASEETLAEEDLTCWSSSCWQPQEAVKGVKTWSELTDVRSVLWSNDAQEESEEEEELVSNFSSWNPSTKSMVQEWQMRSPDEDGESDTL